MAAELIDDPRLAALTAREAVRRMRRSLRLPVLLFLHRRSRENDRLLAVPRDLERGKAAIAEAIYSGVFDLAGHRIVATARSPFLETEAPAAWREALVSFEWLRHLSEVEDALASENARALLRDFLAPGLRRRLSPAQRPDVAATRLIALLSHAPLLLQNADSAFRRRFLDTLAAETRALKRAAPETAEGLARLKVRIALAFAALCLPGRCDARSASAHLSDELDRQIFPDGGHVSRNPQAIAALLKMLLPLRQIYSMRGLAVPRSLFGAIDRMLPALRFFLHGDGATTLFNGASLVPVPLVAALVRQDETLGEPVGHMRQSGYQRLSRGTTTIVADTGLAPPTALSGESHAGTLAFEFSSGRQRFVVNCGAPSAGHEVHRRLARATAAHSTLTLGDRSSARFARSERLDRFLGSPVVAGPSRVPSACEEVAEGQLLTAAHDGYRLAFGLVHEREMLLWHDGMRIEGADRLHPAAGRARMLGPAPEATLRFHLHPDVAAEQAGRGIRLAAGEEVWWFFCDQPATLDDSVFFASAKGPRRTRQIVAVMQPGTAQANWRFERQR